MKTTKKILGIALAVIMLCNVFVIASFAAPAEGGAVKLMLATDKETYAPGDTITFTVSEQVLAAVGAMRASGQYEFAYNSAALQPLSDKNVVAETDDPVIFKDLAGDAAYANCRIIFNDACVGNGSMILDSDATAYNWDKMICVMYMHTAGTEFDATTAPLKLFTFSMKIADNAAAGTYTFGFNQGGYESYTAYSNNVPLNDAIYGYTDDYGYGTATNYDCGVVTFTVESSGGGSGDSGDTPDPTPTVTVSNSDTRVKWSDKANGKIYIGFEGVLTGFTPVTEVKDGRTEVTNIGSVGFRFSTTDATLASGSDVAARTLYDFNDGTYKFRAIVETDYNSESKLYATAYIKLEANGNATLTSDTIISTSVAAEYAEATGKGLPAFGA